MFKNNRKITGALMITLVLILVLWDIVAFFTGGSDDTESYMILQFAESHFTLPFAMGGLLGHWFWPREAPPFGISKGEAFFLVVLPVMMAMSVVDVFVGTPSWILPVVPLIGYVFGSFFWPQKTKR